ncbi:outer membrane beta-barrel protein [Mucilaginibacter aquaedulcis]|uniref:outer membrane beta-barrel protein n=1 Tax=Mucilaginibacter aquaedulcis TaxID=1187081 RepID=UPI0025B4ACEF|nr:outer membrane beta-barrel protein [Mucilaginibacter aquaedulcis]MDN3547696.1 outer membrane beta-barrel protein [Mucilaginibacter aquaedulcis]
MKKQVFLMLALAGITVQLHAQTDPEKKTSSIKDTVATTPVSRALPSPLPSGPFPSADWPGSPIIGEPADAPDYALQKVLGMANNKSRLKIYGWIAPGVNFSTSKNSNIPMSYAIVPNKLELDQAVLRIERQPNTVQTDHLDWGFRLSTFYGMDYRYTTSKGWFSNQLLKNNNLYGVDPVEAYAMLYFPKVGEGMVVKVGRFISPPDIEAQLAPDNYIYTHSLMFTVDPFTFTGVNATIRLNPQWQLELGVHAGNDMAPWTNSAQLNGQAMIRWVSKSTNDSFWGGINSLGNGQFKNEHDNLQMVVGTWSHRFNKTFHMETEAYYMWQYNAYAGGTPIIGPPKSYYPGVGLGTFIPGASKTLGIVNYFQILVSPKDYFTVRNDYLRDYQGQRLGYITPYTSHTIGFVHYFTNWLYIRPEVRYDRAYADGVTPYDNGTRNHQFSGSMDLILRF